jgi:DNA polymerase elongation subunit (family B)
MPFKFELSKIDPNECSIEELEKEIKRLKQIKEEYHGIEQSVKVFINSCYGACASPYFVGYNINIAEAVTLQGQDLIKYANKVINEYFIDLWHKDFELHKKLGLTYVNPIKEKSITVYNDTDSVAADTIINTSNGKKSIESFYNENIINSFNEIAKNEFESVKSDTKILNWTSKNNLYYAKIKRIIRHKVSKNKWKLITKTGKEIVITDDHSMIVFRKGKQLEIKPSAMIKTDKILCIR